jgi:PIN domain nuclease of toxin-antitoxin system
MRLLLDTHVLIWLINGDAALSRKAKQEIDDASMSQETLVSVVCFWEIGMLQVKHRIRLAGSVSDWTHDAVNRPGITVAPLTPEITVAASFLPGRFHHDPADRMIVATARETGATLLTRDRRILRYGARGHLKVMKA